jgi:hypothetical protein
MRKYLPVSFEEDSLLWHGTTSGIAYFYVCVHVCGAIKPASSYEYVYILLQQLSAKHNWEKPKKFSNSTRFCVSAPYLHLLVLEQLALQ